MTAQSVHFVKAKAFTLLELILVMIILATVLAMAAPSLRGFLATSKLNDISDYILAMTRYAKTQAVFEARYYRVNFDPYENRCWISSLTESQHEPLKNNFGNDLLIPSEIELIFENVQREDSIYYFEFNPRGYSRQGSVILKDNQDRMIEVACDSPSEPYEIIEYIDGKRQDK